MRDTRFHIYGWYRDLACTQPFYIGKGLKGRENHWRDRLRYMTNLRLLKAVIEVLAEHGAVPVTILHSDLTNAEACEIERQLIKEIGRQPTGPLANITKGGNGGNDPEAHSRRTKGRKAPNKGVPMSDEQRQKLKEAWARRREFRLAILDQVNKGKRGKPAHNKGKRMSDAQRQKLREAWANNPTARHTEESNAKRSETSRQTYQDPELRARIGTAVKKALSDPQWRAEQSARVKAIWERRTRNRLVKRLCESRIHKDDN